MATLVIENPAMLPHLFPEGIYLVEADRHSKPEAAPTVQAVVEEAPNLETVVAATPTVLEKGTTFVPPDLPPAIPILHGPKNATFLVVLDQPAEGAEKELLGKILEAIGKSLAQVGLLHTSENGGFSAARLLAESEAEHGLLFHPKAMTWLGQPQKGLYQPLQVGSLTLIPSESLSVLADNAVKKKLLWSALKAQFPR